SWRRTVALPNLMIGKPSRWGWKYAHQSSKDSPLSSTLYPALGDTQAMQESSQLLVNGHMALITGSFRVRGWVWLLSMLWVVIGAGGAIYATVTFTHTGYGEGFRGMLQWPGEPQMIIDVGVTTEVVWVLLSAPLLVSRFVRLRGWRQCNWLRVAAWAGSWVAGLALLYQSAEWAVAGEDGNRSVLSVGEMAICAAWLALGA